MSAPSRRMLDLRRLVRYGFAGAASAVTHLGILTVLVELAGFRPVMSSALGFTASIGVSYLLQRSWVFASAVPNHVALPRFLLVTAVGFTLNVVIMWGGTEALQLNYLLVQLVALVAIPLSNYTLNSIWTFR
jgi:putative flippase GtrA